LAFLARTYNEILEDALLILQENTNITRLSPGSKARTILDALSQVVGEVYQEFDLNLSRAFISGASGQFLDLMGIILGEPRLLSQVPSVDDQTQNVKFYVETGTFGDINDNSDINIPRGTVFSSNSDGSGSTYKLSSSVTLPKNSSYYFVSVEGTSPGSDFNVGSQVLEHHDFVDYSDYSNKTLLVTNIYPIANGGDIESDTNYRYRLSKKVTEAEAANETAIRLAALTTPGVADVIIKPRYRGIGTCGIIVKSITPVASDNLIDNVEINVLKVQGLGSVTFVQKQKEIGFAMKTRVWYKKRLTPDELDEIEMAMTDAIFTYVNNLDLGEPIYIDRMMSALFATSDNIATFGGTTKLVDEAWVYLPTKLEDNRVSNKLIGDYTPEEEERIIIEPTISSPVIFERRYGTRPTSE